MKISVWLLVILAGAEFVHSKEPQSINYRLGRHRIDICKSVCNNYEGICLPAWLDPWNFFEPHCEDNGGLGRPETGCVLCLKSHAVTSRAPPTSKTPTTVNTAFSTVPSKYDPCAKVCNNYVGICLPSWLDLKKIFSPHCEDPGQTSGRAKYQCITCLRVNGVVPNPNLVPTTTATTSIASAALPTGCVASCKCVRVIRLSITVKSWVCPLPGEKVPPCDVTDASAQSEETDESKCICGCEFDSQVDEEKTVRKSGDNKRGIWRPIG